jgi:hypothetical protein
MSYTSFLRMLVYGIFIKLYFLLPYMSGWGRV